MSSFTLQVLQFNAHEVAQFEMRGKRFEVSIDCLNVNETVDNIEGAYRYRSFNHRLYRYRNKTSNAWKLVIKV